MKIIQSNVLKKKDITTCDPANVVVVWGILSKSLKLWKVPSDFDLTSTLLKQCASMLTENWKKAANIQRKKLNVLQKVWRTVPEEYLEHYKKAYLSEFRLCWSLKLVTPSLDFQVH